MRKNLLKTGGIFLLINLVLVEVFSIISKILYEKEGMTYTEETFFVITGYVITALLLAFALLAIFNKTGKLLLISFASATVLKFVVSIVSLVYNYRYYVSIYDEAYSYLSFLLAQMLVMILSALSSLGILFLLFRAINGRPFAGIEKVVVILEVCYAIYGIFSVGLTIFTNVYIIGNAFDDSFSTTIYLSNILSTIPNIFYYLGILFVALSARRNSENDVEGEKELSPYVVSIVKHAVLLFLTGGIWLYIWIHRTTKFTSRINYKEYRSPTSQLLLCMFVPFYYIYWVYKTAQIIEIESEKKGIKSNISTICLILSFFVGIVPPIIIQDAINKYITTKAPAFEAKVTNEASVINEEESLLKYKNLLDKGLITQEDYDAKKKQILDM